MATRFYGLANNDPGITPTPDAAWQSTTGFVRRRMKTAAGNGKLAATETRSGVTVTSGANNETLGFQLISEPLSGAQTITGTVTIVLRGLESAANDNINARARGIRVVSGDGTVVRGTLLAEGFHSVTTEISTSLAGHLAANATALSSVSAQSGDRIVVEIGFGMTATGTSPSYDMVIGGNGTDHTTTDLDTTGTVPWIEFSQNLTLNEPIDLAGLGVAQAQATTNVALVQQHTLAGLGVAQAQASTVITFPVGVIGGIHAESNNRGSPIMDSNGNIYTITELAVLDPRPCMRKSTDGGDTWNEVDAANRPSHDDLESLWIAQRGTVIHVLYQRSGTMRVSYATFNTSDAATNPDTWQIKNEVVHLPTTPPANQACSLAIRSNGDVLAFYRTDPVGGFERLAWRKKPSGGSWSAETQVDITASTNFTQVAVVVGANDKVHILYKDDTNSNVLHKSLNSSDVPSLVEIVNDNPTTTDDQMMATPPVYLDVAGVERIFVAWKRLSNGFLVGAAIDDDGVPGAEESISNVAVWEDPPVTTSEQAVATLAVDPATDKIYALYADNSTHDVWKVERNGTWGTNTEILNNVEAQYLAAMVLTHSSGNGGAKVLGIIYDNNPTGVQDAGVPTYTEIELAAGGAINLTVQNVAQAQACRGSGASTVAMVQEKDGNVGATRQTSITATLDNNLQAGNIITVKISSNNVPTITPPDGTWTSIKREVNGTSHVVESFRHAVQAGEVGSPGSWVFSVGATARSLNWHAAELSGVDAAGPVDGTPTSVVGATTSINLPAITVSAGALVEVATAWSGGASAFHTYTEPTGYTELVDQHTAINPSATDSSQHVSYEQYPSAGSTGTITITSSGSGDAAIAYALKPSSGAIVLEEVTSNNLAGLGVTQAQASTQIALTQDHNLAGLGVAQAQETTTIALTQVHVLAGLGVAQGQTVPNITITEESGSQAINVRPVMIRMISGRLFSTSTFIQVRPVPPVTTTPTLTGMGVAQGQATTNIDLTQVHNLSVQNVAQGQATTAIALAQVHVLAGLGVDQAQTATTITLAFQVEERVLASADATTGSGTATQLAISPTGQVVGDVLTVGVIMAGGISTVSPPDGTWELVNQATYNNTLTIAVYRKLITATGETYTFTWSGGSRRAVLFGRAFYNADTVLDATATSQGGGGQTSTTHAASTSGGAGRRWIMVSGKTTAANTPAGTVLNTPSGFTETADLTSTHATNANANGGMHHKAVGSGSTGTQQVNSPDATSLTWGGVAFLLKPGVGAPTLAVASVAQGQATTNIDLTQVHVLSGMGVAQGQATTAPTLVENKTLAGHGVAQGQATTTPTLVENKTLAGLGVAQGQASTNITLGMPGALAGLGVAQAQASTVIALTQVHVLSGLGVAQAQASTTIALVENKTLAGHGVTQGQATTVPNLAQTHNLTVIPAAQAQTTTTINLSGTTSLTVQNVAQAQSVPNITVLRIFNLVLASVTQAQTAQNVNLALTITLALASVGQSSSASILTLTQLHMLVVQGVISPQQLDTIVLGIGALPLIRHGSGKVIKRYGSGKTTRSGGGQMLGRG